MQGQLAEIDIRSILQLIKLGQRTGELYVEAYIPASLTGNTSSLPQCHLPSQSWLVFFFNGQIIYAGTTDGQLNRLSDYIHRYELDEALHNLDVPAIATFNSPEYGYLWALLENHSLTPQQGRTILNGMVHETLFDLLSLHQGTFVFKLAAGLSPQLTTFDIDSLVAALTTQIQAWKQFYPHIQSPHQCPIVTEKSQSNSREDVKTARILQWMDGETSIQQISRYLNRSVFTVAKGIYPYVRQGLIHLSDINHLQPPDDTSEEWHATRVPRIVCIDDGLTIRQTVEQILDEHGYEVTSISNPLRALSLLFQLRPDLILCDIVMPELEGYQVCAMLRQSTVFRQTPIVMLTGKDGFIDRVKARMAGATDYLTKPFGAQELLTLVEKYVGLGNPARPKPDRLLAEAIKDDLELETTSSPFLD
ncbi:response regulator [Oscillatoria sp. CS-180]|uniref:response regulator n=1 Tax=Oscillatoria sp. CS-180 TaxID=3021720 RepID=UPI00232A97C8|nr:response regulator [Oscillatoria sp. CS-180]MDB9525256.1 response regulator [Oscillatoria sp. CS-180]